MATGQASPKAGKVVDIPANAPTIGTATAGSESASVTFTAGSTTTGGPVFSYTAISSPGSITGTSTTSPITVSGLTIGTPYTFTVAGVNPTGTSPYSAASNSATPFNPPGSYESIQTVTATGSETALVFTSIPQTYKHLQIRGLWRYAGNAFNFTIGLRVRFNGDTASNYAWHRLTGDGTSSSTVGYTADYGYFASAAAGGSVSANIFGGTVADILDYSSTSKTKVFRYYAGTEAGTGTTSFETSIGTSMWNSTSAITSISIGFTDAGGTAAAGSTFALYGIKG